MLLVLCFLEVLVFILIREKWFWNARVCKKWNCNAIGIFDAGICIRFKRETFYQQKKINFMALIMFIINVVLITKTKSGSGLVMVGLSVVILFINEKSLLKIFKIMPIIIIAILVIYIISYEFLLHSQLDEMFHKYLGKSIALSGRIDIWRFSLEMFIKKPILGYGYWGLWSDPTYVYRC